VSEAKDSVRLRLVGIAEITADSEGYQKSRFYFDEKSATRRSENVARSPRGHIGGLRVSHQCHSTSRNAVSGGRSIDVT